jgi:abortive infection bacteriophage resistance protein
MKPWKSLQEQVDLFKLRGMVITDEDLAKRYLSRIGYYRLSGYSYPFRQHNAVLSAGATHTQPIDTFEVGTNFSQVLDLYVFDKKLRLLIMDALERIEIAMRFEISHLLGKLNPEAHSRPGLFDQNFVMVNKSFPTTKYQDFMTKHQKNLKRSKGEDFVKHHIITKRESLPIWVACEVWDFGMLSHLFEMMIRTQQTTIANKLGLARGEILVSWIISLSVLRNFCAHHSRVWNRSFGKIPKLPRDGSNKWDNNFPFNTTQLGRVFLLLCICAHMLRSICPNSKWVERLIEHLRSFPQINHPYINLGTMGCCGDWEKILRGG